MTVRPCALITGASSGIGAGFARALAARGEDLVLTARSAERLRALADELQARHGIRVEVLPADLADPHGAEALLAELGRRELEIGTLINNAGFGSHGRFATRDPSGERDQIFVNVLAPLVLARGLIPAMLERRRGTVINVASTAAFQPVPYMASYGATKAFVLSFSEALAEELRGSGVRVLALCPGQTDTAFFDVAGEQARVGRARTVEQVVATALKALERGRDVAVDGLGNALLAGSVRFAPRRLALKIAAALERPRDES